MVHHEPMRFIFDFQSSLLLIFFVHALVYGVLFLIRFVQKAQQSSLWVGLFLVLSALYIAPWMLGFAGWYNTQPYRDILFYVPFQQLYLLGPVVLFYVQSLLNPAFRVRGRRWLHFLPALLYFLFSVVMVVYDKLILQDYYFLADGSDPDFSDWYQITGFLSLAWYFWMAIRYYRQYRRVVPWFLSNATDYSYTWVRNFLVAVFAIIIAWFIERLLSYLIDFSYVGTWWYYFSYAICCYYISIAGHANAVENRLSFQADWWSQHPAVMLAPARTTLALPYEEASFVLVPDLPDEAEPTQVDDEAQLTEWKQRIHEKLITDQYFAQPELSLFDLARALETNVSVLSRMINRGFHLNFNDLVNQYRIQQVMTLLEQGNHKEQTLLSLAFDAGFNSKSTFNRAFKKQTGLSPREYIQQKRL